MPTRVSRSDYNNIMSRLKSLERAVNEVVESRKNEWSNETRFRAEARSVRRAIHLIKSYLRGNEYEDIERFTRKHVDTSLMQRICVLAMSNFIDRNFNTFLDDKWSYIINPNNQLETEYRKLVVDITLETELRDYNWDYSTKFLKEVTGFVSFCNIKSWAESYKRSMEAS